MTNFIQRLVFGPPPPPIVQVVQQTRAKTEHDLFQAELELERAAANRDMYAARLERLGK